jgi:hypothetical protein
VARRRCKKLRQHHGVKIVSADGALIIRGALNKTFVVPHNVPGGVKFAVL